MTALLVFAFSMLLLLLATLAKRLWQEGRVPMMRLTKNHQLPELTLQKGQRFHVFLSHTWSTAQACGPTDFLYPLCRALCSGI